MPADRLGLSRSVQGLLAYLLERWDGHGSIAAREDRYSQLVGFEGIESVGSALRDVWLVLAPVLQAF